MATNNRRRDLLERLDRAYEGKMYLCISALARKIGCDRDVLSSCLKAANVPKRKRGNRIEYAKEDIRDWLYQMENAS